MRGAGQLDEPATANSPCRRMAGVLLGIGPDYDAEATVAPRVAAPNALLCRVQDV